MRGPEEENLNMNKNRAGKETGIVAAINLIAKLGQHCCIYSVTFSLAQWKSGALLGKVCMGSIPVVYMFCISFNFSCARTNKISKMQILGVRHGISN